MNPSLPDASPRGEDINAAVESAEHGTRRTIWAALIANVLIAIVKLIAGVMSGSSAMLSEAAHSFADTVNEIFLLASMRLSRVEPDEGHPFGHGKDTFFWSFIAAVFIFVAGAVFSAYHGIHVIVHPSDETASRFLLNYVVLAVSFVFEGWGLLIAFRHLKLMATAEGESMGEYFETTPNTTMKVPIFENVAALIGLIIAAAGVAATQLSGTALWDGLASMGIAVVLVAVAWRIGVDSRDLLLGASVPAADREQILRTMLGCNGVVSVPRLLTMHLGPRKVLLNAEIELADGMNTDQVEETIQRVTEAVQNVRPEVREVFIEPRYSSAETPGKGQKPSTD